eukprot:scaffold3142_cov60-Phaeocystis_antarctica.AAC.4
MTAVLARPTKRPSAELRPPKVRGDTPSGQLVNLDCLGGVELGCWSFTCGFHYAKPKKRTCKHSGVWEGNSTASYYP